MAGILARNIRYCQDNDSYKIIDGGCGWVKFFLESDDLNDLNDDEDNVEVIEHNCQLKYLLSNHLDLIMK
ncbi:hypothetical protein EWB00_010094 [Schistosoma japonicum]|uniref:Uncharacterized protein n=1 Tax=Schistosoma japonicum TaxID=6182 RepID=A0A4Z2DQ43_SCHJA|nr:hypothetical protein EWB00_010094 [Schistosoma japonicum]